MATRRAQVSLQFEDATLFDSFVQPYKEQKLLNSLIIRCLSAYYYNEEVRNLIDSVTFGNDVVNSDVQSAQSICDNIRASLAMQDFITQELQYTIDAGTEDINSILRSTNNFAENQGVAKTTPNEYGSQLLQIGMNSQNTSSTSESRGQTTQASNVEALCSMLLKAVGKLAEASGNSEVMQILNASPIQNDSVQQPVVQNSVRQESVTQVPVTEEEVDLFSTEQSSELAINNNSDEEDIDTEPEDATDALLEIFGSLKD